MDPSNRSSDHGLRVARDIFAQKIIETGKIETSAAQPKNTTSDRIAKIGSYMMNIRPTTNSQAKITLRSDVEAWIQLREKNSLIVTQKLRSGDSYTITSRPGLSLTTDSPGIEIAVNGVRTPDIEIAKAERNHIAGVLGVVGYTISLDPEELAGDGSLMK